MADQSPRAPPKILFLAKNCCATYPPAKIITSLSIHRRTRVESSYSILAGARRDDLHSPRLPSALFGLIVKYLNDTSCNREHMACPASWYAFTSIRFISPRPPSSPSCLLSAWRSADAPGRRPSAKTRRVCFLI